MNGGTSGLIVAAFAEARRRGSPDWYRMHASTLRQAVVVLSNGAFAEHRYGVRLFTEVLSRFRSLVRIDRSPQGLMIELLARDAVGAVAADATPLPTPVFFGKFVRQDVWAAFANTRLASRFFWDPTRRLVCDRPGPDLISIPPIDTLTVLNWRNDFAEGMAGLDAAEQKLLESWTKGSGVLPASLYDSWRNVFAVRVRQRAREFFALHDPSVFKRGSSGG